MTLPSHAIEIATLDDDKDGITYVVLSKHHFIATTH